MDCNRCEFFQGCSIRKAHDDGTAVFTCGLDFGRGKAETVVHEHRGNGKLVVRYDLPFDKERRTYREWFDEEFKRQLSEFFVKRVKKVEADILAWIEINPICYMNPCRALLDGIYGVTTPAIFPSDNVQVERYDVTKFFLQFPRGLPTELKGIAI